jgi:filamentous hemagglutinin family protein
LFWFGRKQAKTTAAGLIISGSGICCEGIVNQTFRVIWNAAIGAWQAVSEVAKSSGKSSKSSARKLASLLAGVGASVLLTPAHAQLPTGGQVVGGTGQISQSGNTLTVTQNSNRLATDWQSFNIGAGHSVNFVQPNAQAVALNRVLGSDVSVIQGALNANGQVFLVNPNGVLFSPTAQVNVGALVASTLNLSTADFMAGNYRFSGNSTAEVNNQGQIHVANGGHVALLAARIVNSGEIQAPGGQILLGAGQKITLDVGGPVQLQIEEGALNAQIEQGGALKAEGGLVYLSAKAVDALTRSVINHSGLIEASSLVESGGLVRLEGDHITLTTTSQINATGATGDGEVYVGGEWQGTGSMYQATTVTMEAGATIDVSATKVGDGGTAVLWSDLNKSNGATRVYGSLFAKGGNEGGNGGRIETSGHYLSMRGQVDLSAPDGENGLLLLDPKFIIVATADPGGATAATLPGQTDQYLDNATGTSWVTPSDLVSWLNTANVTLQASTDITVSDAVDASGNTGNFNLTLVAGRDILINADITLRGQFYAYSNNLAAGADNRDPGAGNFTMASNTKIDTATVPARLIRIENRNTGTQGGKATVAGLRINSGIYNQGASNNWSVTVRADQIDFVGGPDSITDVSTDSAAISYLSYNFENFALDRPIIVGGDGADDTNALVFNVRDLQAFASTPYFHLINFGQSLSTGGLTLTGPLPLKAGINVFRNNGVAGSITLASDLTINSDGRWLRFQAGTGDNGRFTQLAGATVNTVSSSGSGAIEIYSDSIDLQGAAGSLRTNYNGLGAGITIAPSTASRNVVIGADGTVSDFALTARELAVLTALPSASWLSLTIGHSSGTGDMTLFGDLSLASSAGWIQFRNPGAGGRITLDSTAQITGNTLQFEAGSGNNGVFTQAAGSSVIAASHLYLRADDFVLNGSANSLSSNFTLSVTPRTANRPIVLGGDGVAGQLGLSVDEMSTLESKDPSNSTVNGIIIGAGGGNQTASPFASGGITVAGALNLTSSLILRQTTGSVNGFTINAPIATTRRLLIGANNNPAPIYLNAAISSGSSTQLLNNNVTIGANNVSINSDTVRIFISSPDNTTTTLKVVNHGTYDFSVSALDLNLEGNWDGTGARTVQPSSSLLTRNIELAGATTGTLLGLSTTELGYLQNGSPSSVTIGRSNGTGTITGGAFSFDDLLVLRGGAVLQTGAWTLSGNLAINSTGAITLTNALNNFAGSVGLTNSGTNNVSITDVDGLILGESSIGGNLTVLTGGALTQTAALAVTGTTAITAGATNNVTLDNANNNFTGALSVVSGKNISIIDSNAMTLAGVIASGTIDMATLTGDLSITENISTSDTSANAIILNAGKNAAAGTATGGNIVVTSGKTVTVGTGGTAKLYTGSITDSTGLTDLIGSGSGRFRYNSDETDTNYTTALGTGLYAIYREQPTVTVTARNDSKTYDGSTYSGGNGIDYAGFVNGDSSSSLAGTLIYSGTSQGAVNAGSYTITPSGLSSGLGYELSYVDGTLTINAALITAITGNLTGSVSKTYDGTNVATLEASNYLLTGWVGSDSAIVTKLSGTYDDPNAGSAKIVTVNLSNDDYLAVGGTDLSNYTLPTSISGNVGLITKAQLTVTADNQSRLYGQANPTFTQTITGFVNGEDATSAGVTGTALGSSAATTATGVGTVAITGSVGSLAAANYDFTAANGTLTINKAQLTVTADNQSRLYGQANPTFTQTITGFVNGEDATSAGITGTALGSSTATTATGVGTVAITASVGSLAAANYDFTAANGTLTITQRPITVSAADQSRVYGDANPTSGLTTVTTGSLVNGDTLGSATLSSAATLTTAAGQTAALTPSAQTFSAGTAGNYLISYADGTLTITQRPITIVADNKSKAFGQSDPFLSWQVTQGSLVGSDNFSGSLTRALGESIGSYVIDASALTNSNYLVTANNGLLTIIENTAYSNVLANALIAIPENFIDTSVVSQSLIFPPPTGLNNQSAFSASGGLTFLPVDSLTEGASANPANASGGSGFAPTQGGRDALGFMPIFVVRGGLNLPEAAQNAFGQIPQAQQNNTVQ